jgi:hypothetical protein
VIHKYSPVPPCRSFHLPYSYLISREYLKWKSSPFCASVLLITMCMRTLRILSCKHCPNFEFFINSISYSFRSIANQNGVRYSDSTAVQNVNKPFVYITDLTSTLSLVHIIK